MYIDGDPRVFDNDHRVLARCQKRPRVDYTYLQIDRGICYV